MKKHKPTSISRNLTYSLVLTVVIASTVIIGLNYFNAARKARTELSKNAQKNITYLTDILELPMWNVNYQSIKQICNSFSRNDLIIQLKISDTRGNILCNIEKDNTGSLIKRTGKVIYDEKLLGNVEISLSPRHYKEKNIELLWASIITATIIIGTLIIMTGFLLRVFLEKPVLLLGKVVDSYAAGSYEALDKHVPVKEFNSFVSILGQMGDTIKAQISELKKSEQRFRDLFNSINAIIYTQDLEGCFTSVNPALCKAFGHKKDELIGRQASDFMKPEFVPTFKSGYLEPIKKQGNQEGTTIYFKKNGEKLYLEYKSVLVQPEEGEPFISGTGRDVTEKILSERKFAKLQEQVAQSQKMESIGTLAGGIAHDFNNILFPIVGHTEMLLEDVPEDGSTRDSLNQIYTSALRAKDLVKQILTFSSQESSELTLMKMQPVVKEALKLIRSTIPTTIEIIQDINPDCGVIKADPTQIHQIVMNLATNAYHAMEETGGELKVRLKEIELGEYDVLRPGMKPGIYACLTITDTGIGMDKELIRTIFDPFFTTKERGKGTGMGLSVVHGIVANMNGAIQVYSEPGEGTQFHVYLPVEKNFSEEQVTHSKIEIQCGTEQILLVDDEEAILTMEKRMLERLGYQVTSRTGSIEALEAFRANHDKFDLIITDMAMPNMPGDKLSAELIKIRPGIPILLCTGFSETISEEKAASLGIKGFLWKPIVMKDLAHKIREVLDQN